MNHTGTQRESLIVNRNDASECPAPDALRAYLDERLSSEDSQLIEQHVETCGECESSIQSLLKLESTLFPLSPQTASAQDESIPPENLQHYECLELLDTGGFGMVWKMRDLRFERLVAVKVMQARHAKQPSLVRRFLAEAQICSQLSHPFIVPVHDMGVLPDGRGFYVMKLVEGQRLDQHFAPPIANSDGFMPRIQAFGNICQALAHAHEKQVIHRDLKPQNIMVGGHGEIQVMDWGLARSIGEVADGDSALPDRVRETTRLKSDQTAAGAVGTYAYMPPEQAQNGAAADYRSDVFSLGGILCYLLTGSPPFTQTEKTSLADQVKFGDLSDARERLSECVADPRIVQLAFHCLSVKPADRPSDAGVVSGVVQRLLFDIEQELQNERIQNAEQRLKMEEGRKRRFLWTALAAAVVIVAVTISATLYSNQLKRENRIVQARQLLDKADAEIRSGNYQAGHEQLTLAANLTPAEEADRRRRLDEDAQLCVALDNVFQKQAEVIAFKFNGQLISDSPRQAAIARALAAYETLLDDPVRLADRHESSPARQWVAAAFAAQAYLMWERDHLNDGSEHNRSTAKNEVTEGNSLRKQINDLLTIAVSLDDPSSVNAALYDETNWSNPEKIALILADGLETVSPGALRVALEIMLSADLDSETISSVCARRADDFWVNYRWGNALAAKGREEALRFCQAAVAIRPDDHGARVVLGTLLANRGDLQAAIREYRKAIELNPDSATAHNNLGTVLRDLDEHDEAVAAFQRSIDCNKIPEYVLPHVNWASLLKQNGQLELAEKKLNEAIQLNPNSAYAYFHRGTLLDERQKLDAAVEAYERALELNPDYSFAHNNLGKTLATIAGQSRQQGDLKRGDEMIAAAQAHFQKAAASDPTNAWAFVNLANTFDDQGNIELAILNFQKAVEVDPAHPFAGFNLANTLLNSRRYAEAEIQIRDYLLRHPDHAVSHFLHGLSLGHLGQFSASKTALLEAIRLSDEQQRPMQGPRDVLAELEPLLAMEGTLAEAFAEPAMQQGHPVDVSDFFYRKQMHGIAAKILSRGIETDPETAVPRFLMRASRFYALAGRDSADEAQRSQHWIDAGNLYARALDEFEKGPTEENSMADIRRAILDRDLECVREDQLAEMPTDAQVIWKKNWERANRILASDQESEAPSK